MIKAKDFENIAKIINKSTDKRSAYFHQYYFRTDTNKLIDDLSTYFKSQNAKFKEDKFREMCLK